MKLSMIRQRCLGDEFAMFKQLKASGFDGIDLSMEPFFDRGSDFLGGIDNWTDEAIKDYFTDLKEKADSVGIKIFQIHSAFDGHPRYYSGEEEIIKRIECSIKACHYLGSQHCVTHPIIDVRRKYDVMEEETFPAVIDLYRKLIPCLEKYDVYCCIENMWNVDTVFGHICPTIFSRAKEMVKACELLGDRFKICVDVGHGLLTQDDPVEMVRICGDKLVCLHVHDNDGLCDLHTIPFAHRQAPEGMVWKPLAMDWTGLMKALKEIGYKGVLNFEVVIPGPKEIVPAGMDYLAAVGRYLSDIYENA